MQATHTQMHIDTPYLERATPRVSAKQEKFLTARTFQPWNRLVSEDGGLSFGCFQLETGEPSAFNLRFPASPGGWTIWSIVCSQLYSSVILFYLVLFVILFYFLLKAVFV